MLQASFQIAILWLYIAMVNLGPPPRQRAWLGGMALAFFIFEALRAFDYWKGAANG